MRSFFHFFAWTKDRQTDRQTDRLTDWSKILLNIMTDITILSGKICIILLLTVNRQHHFHSGYEDLNVKTLTNPNPNPYPNPKLIS